nr:hypothetical protein [Tanacetum cinerariifolium]
MCLFTWYKIHYKKQNQRISKWLESDNSILNSLSGLSHVWFRPFSAMNKMRRAENVEKVEVNSSTLRQDDTQTIPDTRLEPRSDKESLEVELIAEVQPFNINEEEEESAKDDFELKQNEKGKHVEESRSTSSPTTTRSLRIHSTLISSDTEKL